MYLFIYIFIYVHHKRLKNPRKYVIFVVHLRNKGLAVRIHLKKGKIKAQTTILVLHRVTKIYYFLIRKMKENIYPLQVSDTFIFTLFQRPLFSIL